MEKMKCYLFLVSFSIMSLVFSQEIIKPLSFTEDSISINTNIRIKEAISFKNVKIVFEEVISDSRCLNRAKCDNVGKAIILFKIFVDERFLKDTKASVDGEGYIFESGNMIYKINDYKIYISKLYPLPRYSREIDKQSYNADFFVKKVYDFDD